MCITGICHDKYLTGLLRYGSIYTLGRNWLLTKPHRWKKFCITVTETLRKEIILKSDSLEQAVSNVEQAYADGRIVLDADDLVCDPVTGETRRIERSGFYTDEQVQRMEVSSFGNQL